MSHDYYIILYVKNSVLFPNLCKIFTLYNPDKKTDHEKHGLFYWQRNRDSNPNKQSQSLSCYRYTIPLKNV